MPFGILGWLQDWLERALPAREVYVRSEGAVRYLTLSTRTQAVVVGGAIVLIAWSLVFTVNAYVSGSTIAYQDQALVDVRDGYERQVRKLNDRYARLEAELQDSERRFDEIVRQLSGQHGKLENAAGMELALQGRLDASRRRLDEVTEQRDDALTKLEEIRLASLDMERRLAEAQRVAEQRRASLDDFVATLDATARERDEARRRVRELDAEVARLDGDISDIRRHQEQVMVQLEEATRASLTELENIIDRTGVDVDGLVQEIERTYSGEGGPFIPIMYRAPEAALGFPASEEAVAEMIDELHRVNSLRIAIEKLPLARPVTDPHRFTSGFGPRRHPILGRWAQHNGIDLAAPIGTPIYATVGGVVRFAGVQGGYGKVIKIRHSLGYESVYAHLNAINVSEGQTIAQGDMIGELGNTGRSTGPHLHYEIRRYGKALNPQRFIEAGRNVF